MSTIMTELYRARNGKIFHAPECWAAGERSEWLWARSRTYLQVLEDSHGLNIYPCKHCLPPTYNPLTDEGERTA